MKAMKEEGGCPFTKMCKLAGTPHVGAILIVLFVIAGGVYFFMLNCDGTLISAGKTVKPLNALNEKEEIENGLKQFRPPPCGYIKIINTPGDEGMELKQVQFRGAPGDPESHITRGTSAFVQPGYEKFVKNANKDIIDVPKSQTPSIVIPPDYVPGASPEAVPTLTDQVTFK